MTVVAVICAVLALAAVAIRMMQTRAARAEMPVYQRLQQALYSSAAEAAHEAVAAIDEVEDPTAARPETRPLVPAMRSPRPGETRVVTVVGRWDDAGEPPRPAPAGEPLTEDAPGSGPLASVRAIASGGIATVGAAGSLAERAERRAWGRSHRRRRFGA